MDGSGAARRARWCGRPGDEFGVLAEHLPGLRERFEDVARRRREAEQAGARE